MTAIGHGGAPGQYVTFKGATLPDMGLVDWDAVFDPASPVIERLLELSGVLIGFPRHLSQHVGGFVIARDLLERMVPVENAAMPERTVIQWDKDDLDALGLLKVDVLGLGMLAAIRRAFRAGTVKNLWLGGGFGQKADHPELHPEDRGVPVPDPAHGAQERAVASQHEHAEQVVGRGGMAALETPRHGRRALSPKDLDPSRLQPGFEFFGCRGGAGVLLDVHADPAHDRRHTFPGLFFFHAVGILLLRSSPVFIYAETVNRKHVNPRKSRSPGNRGCRSGGSRC